MVNFHVAMQDLPLEATHLKKGQRVTYTNCYGVVFPGHTIQGFSIDTNAATEAYIDSDCYWTTKPFSSLTPEEKPNFVFFEYYDREAAHLVERAFSYSHTISIERFEELISELGLQTAQATISRDCDTSESLEQCRFVNPRLGISDGSIGRRNNLTVLAEYGNLIVAFVAGQAWNDLAAS